MRHTLHLLYAVAFLLISHAAATAVPVAPMELFADQEIFNNTCRTLAVEDFEDTNAPPNLLANCPNPFNSMTNNECFSEGALIPGFNITAEGPIMFIPGALVVVTPNTATLINVAVGSTEDTSNTNISFDDDNVNAVGMLLAVTDITTPINAPFDIEIYGSEDVLLGTTTVDVFGVSGTFLGIRSPEQPISRVEIVGLEDRAFELIYELSFGSCDITRPIPTLSEWGLIAMAGLIGIAGLLAVRMRRAAV